MDNTGVLLTSETDGVLGDDAQADAGVLDTDNDSKDSSDVNSDRPADEEEVPVDAAAEPEAENPDVVELDVSDLIGEDSLANTASVLGASAVASAAYDAGYPLNDEESVTITVNKNWLGQTGDQATVQLFADGVFVKSITLSSENDWAYTFKQLTKYRDSGEEIRYTIEEETQSGYKASYEIGRTDNTY